MQHKSVTRIICLVLCVAALFSLSACGKNTMTQKTVAAMDTIMTLTAYGSNADKGLSAATSVITSLDSMLDPQLETSTVYKINHANGETVVVSSQIAEMIQKAYTVYKRSNGSLDITIYPLVELWGFEDERYYVPNGVELLEKVGELCFDQLTLTNYPASGTYTLTLPSYGKVTFAAVAKGCASNEAVKAMSDAGVTSGIVSLGGNVQTLGYKPDGSLWTVAIQDPNDPSSFVGTLDVGQTALVTSGGYQRNFTDITTGTVYQHVLRPNSGLPVTNTLQSVTIICEDGTLADCLSTAMYVLGQSQALNYWRSYGNKEGEEFEMILINKDNEIICTSGLIEQFNLTNECYTVTFTE